ncbi:hypothetical protein Nekkels2_78 [Cellulophaga phage Nekkels_2]|nr:hypothetical protein Nekkels2_78 [Cellulophaga phage Nekkels_2]
MKHNTQTVGSKVIVMWMEKLSKNKFKTNFSCATELSVGDEIETNGGFYSIDEIKSNRPSTVKGRDYVETETTRIRVKN